jgi:FkbM family methyltransferase
VPFRRHFPSALNSMATVWNFSELNLGAFGTLVDVGANDSQMAKLLLAMSPKARLISFEPLAGCKPIGEVHRCALSDVNGTGKMFLLTQDTYGAVLNASDVPHNDEQAVEVKRFDSLGISIADLPGPVLLKVDTEGHEMQVLRGFGDQLKKVDVLLLEVQNTQYEGHAPDALDTFSFLRNAGFTKSRVLFSWFDGVKPPAYFDVLFWRG